MLLWQFLVVYLFVLSFQGEGGPGVYILIRNLYLFSAISENDIFPPVVTRRFFYSYQALFALFLSYSAFILPFYIPFSPFLSLFLPLSFPFLPFFFPFLPFFFSLSSFFFPLSSFFSSLFQFFPPNDFGWYPPRGVFPIYTVDSWWGMMKKNSIVVQNKFFPFCSFDKSWACLFSREMIVTDPKRNLLCFFCFCFRKWYGTWRSFACDFFLRNDTVRLTQNIAHETSEISRNTVCFASILHFTK